MPSRSWIIGSGGLLGSSVAAEITRRGQQVFTSVVPWSDATSARAVLLRDSARFFDALGNDEQWNIVWCAGAGVNGTSALSFAEENDQMTDVLGDIERRAPGRGTFFLASSAGGVYAGTPSAPHDEFSPVTPLGDYGVAKLNAEKAVTEFGGRCPVNVVIGRFANLYGPGQNLSKPQGLISHLCRGYLLASPVSIYVPMDTLRDYLFVRDAAEMVADALTLSSGQAHEPTVKVFASGQAVTIGAILGACRTVFRRRPNVVLAASPLASVQGRDLRLRSSVWTPIDRRTHRTLPAGIASTLEATRHALVTVPR